MIVNVNPYDTGFDENTHVMRFAAVAREVHITAAPAPVRSLPVPAAPKPPSKKAPAFPTLIPPKAKEVRRRQVIVTSGGTGGRVVSHTRLEVLEGASHNFLILYVGS
jgi:kinesin family member 20